MRKISNKTSKGDSSAKTVRTLETISKVSMYLVVFLLPIFFLPWTANALDFNKQGLLVVLTLISLLSWGLKILIERKIKFRETRMYFLVGGLVLAYLLSNVFSLWRYGSFWGWPQISAESLLTVIGLGLFYFLVVNVFGRKDILNSVILLVFSSSLAMIFGLLQLYGKFILPWSFTKIAVFNTLGSASALGIFAVIMMPLLTVLIFAVKKKWLRIVLIVSFVLAIITAVAVDFSPAWWALMVGLAVLIAVFGLQKGNLLDAKWIMFPMLLLALSLFLIFFNVRLPGIPDRPTEIYLSQGASLNIAGKTIIERPLFGSGSGTFAYQFSKHKNPNFNQNTFWNVVFEKSGSKFLEFLTTTGILGVAAFLGLVGAFVFFGIKFFVLGKEKIQAIIGRGKEISGVEGFGWLLSLGIFSSLTTLIAAFFLYSSNLTLDFVFFLFAGLFTSLVLSAPREIDLKTSSLATLSITFIFTVLVIFSLSLFILEGGRYAASIDYSQGLGRWFQGDSKGAVDHLEDAVTSNQGVDLYWRELSQAYLAQLNTEIRRTDLTQEEINSRAHLLISNAVNSAKRASDLNPSSVTNWSIRGLVYKNLIGVLPGVEDWAARMYDRASELEPASPVYPTQKGISYLTQYVVQPEGEKDESLLARAQEAFNKAIELKSDYAPARFQLAMTYQRQGKTQQAIKGLEETKSFAPFDIGLGFQLGLLYYQSKNYSKAQEELEKVLVQDPNYANALYFLGLAYDDQGKKTKALEQFEKVADLNPDNQEVKRIIDNLRAGEPALKGITEEEPPETPIEE